MKRDYQICAPLYCGSCRYTKPRAGGQHVVSDDGLHQKFKCADCLARDSQKVAA